MERVVYIVEGHCNESQNARGARTWSQLPVDTLESALVSTQVGNGFVVERCAALRDTITFLQILSRRLIARTDPIIVSRHDPEVDDEDEEQATFVPMHKKPFWEFSRWSEKASKSGNLTVTDVFAKQLMQVSKCSHVVL